MNNVIRISLALLLVFTVLPAFAEEVIPLGIIASGTNAGSEKELSSSDTMEIASGASINLDTPSGVPINIVASGNPGGVRTLTIDDGSNTVLTTTNDSNTVSIPSPYTLGLGVSLPLASGGTAASTAAGARTNLGVDPAGTDNSTNVTLAGTLDYLTLSGQEITLNAVDLTTDVTGDLPVAEGGTGASTVGAAQSNLGLELGTNVQAWDTDLDALAGLAKTDSSFIVGNGSTWVVETGSTVRDSIGLGPGNAVAFATATAGGFIATSQFVMGSDVFFDSLKQLRNVASLDATTESTIESALDTLPNLTSIAGWTVQNVSATGTPMFSTLDVGDSSIATNANMDVDLSAGRTRITGNGGSGLWLNNANIVRTNTATSSDMFIDVSDELFLREADNSFQTDFYFDFDANKMGIGTVLPEHELDVVGIIQAHTSFRMGESTGSPVYWIKGTGDPNGVHTAPVGSFYSRTNGGTGTTLYVKESGTGNTGWVAK